MVALISGFNHLVAVLIKRQFSLNSSVTQSFLKSSIALEFNKVLAICMYGVPGNIVSQQCFTSTNQGNYYWLANTQVSQSNWNSHVARVVPEPVSYLQSQLFIPGRIPAEMRQYASHVNSCSGSNYIPASIGVCPPGFIAGCAPGLQPLRQSCFTGIRYMDDYNPPTVYQPGGFILGYQGINAQEGRYIVGDIEVHSHQGSIYQPPGMPESTVDNCIGAQQATGTQQTYDPALPVQFYDVEGGVIPTIFNTAPLCASGYENLFVNQVGEDVVRPQNAGNATDSTVVEVEVIHSPSEEWEVVNQPPENHEVLADNKNEYVGADPERSSTKATRAQRKARRSKQASGSNYHGSCLSKEQDVKPRASLQAELPPEPNKVKADSLRPSREGGNCAKSQAVGKAVTLSSICLRESLELLVEDMSNGDKSFFITQLESVLKTIKNEKNRVIFTHWQVKMFADVRVSLELSLKEQVELNNKERMRELLALFDPLDLILMEAIRDNFGAPDRQKVSIAFQVFDAVVSGGGVEFDYYQLFRPEWIYLFDKISPVLIANLIMKASGNKKVALRAQYDLVSAAYECFKRQVLGNEQARMEIGEVEECFKLFWRSFCRLSLYFGQLFDQGLLPAGHSFLEESIRDGQRDIHFEKKKYLTTYEKKRLDWIDSKRKRIELAAQKKEEGGELVPVAKANQVDALPQHVADILPEIVSTEEDLMPLESDFQILQRAALLFGEENFSEAKPLYEKVAKKNDGTPQVCFSRVALCEIELNEFMARELPNINEVQESAALVFNDYSKGYFSRSHHVSIKEPELKKYSDNADKLRERLLQ